MGCGAALAQHNARHVGGVEHRHCRRGEFLRQQHGARLQGGKICLGQAQQQPEHSPPQIPHIGRPLAGDLVIGGGKQVNKQVARGGESLFSRLPGGDAPFHLAVQIGVPYHGRLAADNIPLLLARHFRHPVGLGFCDAAEGLHRVVVALQLQLYVGDLPLQAAHRLFPVNQGVAHSNAR